MDEFGINLEPQLLENLNKNKKVLENTYNSLFDRISKKDISKISKQSKSEVFEKNKLKLSFFLKKIVLDLDEKKVYYFNSFLKGKKEYLDIFSSSLVLHYLENASGTPTSGKWIPYRELPGGLFYADTIPKVLEPVVRIYGRNGSEFLRKGEKIGGKICKDFEYGLIIYPFEMTPILFVLYERDLEFEADLKVFFDPSVSFYLKTDVIKILIVDIAAKLCY